MPQTVDAIHENGVLRLLNPLDGVKEQTRVRVTIEVVDPLLKFPTNIEELSDEETFEMLRMVAREPEM